MTSAEDAVRARALAVLRADAGLMALVHGIFDGVLPRASLPYVSVSGAEGSDWGTKDRAGREVRAMLVLHGAGSSPGAAAAGRIEAAAGALRGATDGWSIVSARVVRTRLVLAREGAWRHEVVVRCRCLAD